MTSGEVGTAGVVPQGPQGVGLARAARQVARQAAAAPGVPAAQLRPWSRRHG